MDSHLHFAVLALAEELEFECAAQRLRISASELREQIDRLEKLLSLVLFERDANHVKLTTSGRVYVEQIRKRRLT